MCNCIRRICVWRVLNVLGASATPLITRPRHNGSDLLWLELADPHRDALRRQLILRPSLAAQGNSSQRNQTSLTAPTHAMAAVWHSEPSSLQLPDLHKTGVSQCRGVPSVVTKVGTCNGVGLVGTKASCLAGHE